MRTLLLLLAIVGSIRADVSLAPLFKDHAVLQRDQSVPVWGRADPGERVTVTFADQTVGTTADAEGRWRILLTPLAPSSSPADLRVEGKNRVIVSDLLVGDVWLCAGQSNMEFRVKDALQASAEISSANNPLIRHFKVAQSAAENPSDQAAGEWAVCSPATVGEFTAVGYFFARELQPRTGVPIGIINSSVGGTMIESWMSPAGLGSDPAFAQAHERWRRVQAERPAVRAEFERALAAWTAEEAAAKKRGAKFTQPKPYERRLPGPGLAPSSLFNGMINPLLPYRLSGVLWYQGESNWYNGDEYGALFTALIRSWRDHFGQPELPFFWVQLPNLTLRGAGEPTGTEYAKVRDGQTQALALPRTGQVVAIDVGDPHDIHPKNKQEVARRLALLARAHVFGAQVDSSGPTFQSATVEGASIRVRFAHAGTGLTARNRPLQAFQIAGADQRFYPAVARIERETVVVSAREVPAPVAVRYAWFNCPSANLFNGAGLPAEPFRSDRW